MYSQRRSTREIYLTGERRASARRRRRRRRRAGGSARRAPGAGALAARAAPMAPRGPTAGREPSVAACTNGWRPWTAPAVFRSKSLRCSVACFVCEVAKSTADAAFSKTEFSVIATEPPARIGRWVVSLAGGGWCATRRGGSGGGGSAAEVAAVAAAGWGRGGAPPELIAMPAPALAWMRLLSTTSCELFQEETPSPSAPTISLCLRTTAPPLATTLAPRREADGVVGGDERAAVDFDPRAEAREDAAVAQRHARCRAHPQPALRVLRPLALLVRLGARRRRHLVHRPRRAGGGGVGEDAEGVVDGRRAAATSRSSFASGACRPRRRRRR